MHNVRIFRNISRALLFKLFQAKRAYVLKEWLNLTRVMVPDVPVETSRRIVPLRLDRDLALLAGDVLDIRDFIYGGIHRKHKKKLYIKLREALLVEAQHNKKKKEILSWFKKQNESIHPFIESEDQYLSSPSLSDSDDNVDEDESTEDYIG